jgi:NAD(P)-dependent dehydrogenase (short-subunit alcohol dehydrogenase family)
VAPGSLSGKVAIVTGAAGGIGRVLVEALLAQGARVAALDVSAPRLAALRESARMRSENNLLALEIDVSDYAACQGAVDETISKLGGLHALINNAAIGLDAIRADHQKVPIGIRELSPAMWQRFVATNFTGAWNMTRASIEHMLAQRNGRIINITTSFATMLRGGFHPYGPCKAALEAMSAGHAEEFKGSGVTVNVVLPGGPVDTPMIPPESGFDRQALIAPAVMAPPILWLCSDAADGITGNRYIAACWDAAKPAEEAERQCRAPAGWPGLGPPMLSPRHRST